MFKNFYLLSTVLSTFAAINSCNHVVQDITGFMLSMEKLRHNDLSNYEPKSLRWKMVEPRVQPGGLGGEELLLSLFLKGVQWGTKKSQTDGGKRDYLYIVPSEQGLADTQPSGKKSPFMVKWRWIYFDLSRPSVARQQMKSLICSQTFPGWSQNWDVFSWL